jgi:hypothetical protein
MGKNILIKMTMGKPPNEMGNCQFASPWLRHWFRVKFWEYMPNSTSKISGVSKNSWIVTKKGKEKVFLNYKL